MSPGEPWLLPDWPAPPGVRAISTTRRGGCSSGRHASLNLGLRSGDAPAAVSRNRARLREQLPADPHWLRQVHGTAVVRWPPLAPEYALEPEADAAWTSERGVVCAVQTADCLPLLLCDDAGRCVAAVHAGWRGLAAGVIEAAVASLPVAPERLLAWLGPAIGPTRFEVGAEVREAFVATDAAAAAAFTALPRPGQFLADLYALARRRLARRGVFRVSGGDRCTVSEPEIFFSYRRDGTTGRQASLIWLE